MFHVLLRVLLCLLWFDFLFVIQVNLPSAILTSAIFALRYFAFGDSDFVFFCLCVQKMFYQTPHATSLQFSILIFQFCSCINVVCFLLCHASQFAVRQNYESLVFLISLHFSIFIFDFPPLLVLPTLIVIAPYFFVCISYFAPNPKK